MRMTAHEKFEAKCTSDLIEGRGRGGQWVGATKARQYYDRRLLNYYRKETLKLDLFKVNVDYKDNYIAQLKHNEALKKQCKAYLASIEYCHSIIGLQSDTIINLKETIAKNKGK